MDFIEWRTEAVNLLTVRVPAAEQDVRRQHQQLRDAFGATVYQDLIGKELTTLDQERTRWEESVHSALSGLKRKLRDVETSSLKQNIQEFKKNNKENFASLRSQELALTAFFETTDWDVRFEDMVTSKSDPTISEKPRKKNPEKKEDSELADLRSAIAALTAELDGENCTGALTPEEHALFLRYHGNFKRLETALPQLTPQQIADHTTWWFGARLPKEQLKRRLLGEWRERREALRLRTLDPHLNEERKRATPPGSARSDGDGERKRQAVETWRTRREEQRDREQRESAMAKDERRKQEREERMRRQEERHAVIAKLNEEKGRISREAETARAEIEERERQERALLVRASATRIGERNRAIEEKKKTLIEAKTEKQQQRQLLQMTLAAKEAGKIKVESKLFAQTHTGAFREQTQDEDLEREKFLDRFGKRRADSFGGQVLRMQGRAVPGWRQK